MHIQAPRVLSALMQCNSVHRLRHYYKGGGDYFLYNQLAVTPEIPAADRQSYYGSFTRDICDKYLTVFADFKYTRSFFDGSVSATQFARDAFKGPNGFEFSPSGSQCANPEPV